MPFPAILDDLSLVLFLEARKFVSLNKEIYTQILTFEIRLFSRGFKNRRSHLEALTKKSLIFRCLPDLFSSASEARLTPWNKVDFRMKGGPSCGLSLDLHD